MTLTACSTPEEDEKFFCKAHAAHSRRRLSIAIVKLLKESDILHLNIHEYVALSVKLSSCFHGDMLKFYLCRSIESDYEKDSFRFLVTEERCWERCAGDDSTVSKLLQLHKALKFDLKSIVMMTTKKHFEAEVKYSNKAVDAPHDSTSHIKSHRRHQVTPSCQQTLTENAFQLKHSHQKFSSRFLKASRLERREEQLALDWHDTNAMLSRC